MSIGPIDLLLIIFALLNLSFALFVYAQSNRSLAVVFYALISLFASLWSVSTLATRIPTLPQIYFTVAIYGHYIFGYFAYLSFLWFALYYPERGKGTLAIPSAISISSILFLALMTTPGFLFDRIGTEGTLAERITFHNAGYTAFIAMLTAVFVGGLILLAIKLYRLNGPEATKVNDRDQVFYAMLANFIAGSLGIFLNLLLPLHGDFSFFYISPILVTIALTGIGLYNMVRFGLFHAKIVLAEFFTVAIWILFFSRIVVAENYRELTLNVVLFLGSLFFGVFLIQSVIKEVRAREEIDKLAKRLSDTNWQLARSNEELQIIDQRKSEFVSIVSHQLRTPVTAIKGYSSLILEGSYGPISHPVKEATQKIFVSSDRLVKMISDFLNISKIEQGAMTYNFSTVDMGKMVHDLVEEFKIAAGEKRLALKDNIPKHEHFLATADEGKIRQIISNLIDNAIKYTPDGKVEVEVARDRVRGTVIVKIKDTGIGLSQDDIHHLFAKFTRGALGQKMQTDGSGIGLYVAKKMLEAHRGKIWVDSEGPGKGSTFAIELLAEE